MKMPKVMIGIPTMGSVHPILMMTVLSWMNQATQSKLYSMTFFPTTGIQPVDNARNTIVDAFLASDSTHLLFVDSDTIPPPDVILQFLAHEKDIISAMTPIVEYDEEKDQYWRRWNCVGMDDKHMVPGTGVLQAKGCGGSCVMIKREVFEALSKPYFRFQYEDDNGKPVVVTEDIYFIIKALSKGIKAYADTGILCRHFKTCMF
jgi:hypothetical protein